MKMEKEKMIAGERYHSNDDELVKGRMKARKLTRLYNQTLETDGQKRKRVRKACGNWG